MTFRSEVVPEVVWDTLTYGFRTDVRGRQPGGPARESNDAARVALISRIPSAPNFKRPFREWRAK